jgi:hypothetical protein
MSGRSLYGTVRVSNGGGDGYGYVAAIDEASPLLSVTDDDKNEEGSSGSSPPSAAPTPIGSSSSWSSSLESLRESLRGRWSHLTFDWISPLLEKGNANGQLVAEDLEDWPLPRDCQAAEVYAAFRRCWEDELGRAAKAHAKDEAFVGGDADGLHADDDDDDDDAALFDARDLRPSLIRALFRAYGRDFVRAGLLKLVHDSCLFVGPQVLNRLIRFLRDPGAPPSYGLGLALAGE